MLVLETHILIGGKSFRGKQANILYVDLVIKTVTVKSHLVVN